MGKTRRYKSSKGGKVIASGGYGCVFDPALKCEGSTKRDKNKISKVMTERHATQEYDEINNIKDKLDNITNYEDYFLLNDITLCRPSKLTSVDLVGFNDKCSALPKNNITKTNINDNLDKIMTLNIPNGGLPVDDFIYDNGSFKKIYEVHMKLVKLLKCGIIPMNKKNIYHCDIKDSNVLVDSKEKERDLKTRLIDWGLSVQYSKNEDDPFPRNWKNRPLQFNVPFSIIIFSDSFLERYTTYLKDGGKVDNMSLKPFVIDYLKFWMNERGAGHYKFINEIIYKLYSNDISNISEKSKPVYVETQLTMPLIVDYITNVLVHYTKFKSNGKLNLREYLNEVFIKIVDIYGFICIYYPLLELLYNNYLTLDNDKLKLFNKIVFVYKKYLYSPRHTPYNEGELFSDLKELGNLIYIIANGKKKISFSTGGSHSRTRKMPTSSSLFKRRPLIKRFTNPIFLSLK